MTVIAQDVLTVQASTVASESCFSLSGRILSERRSSLSARSLQLCICFEDYLDSVKRKQDTKSLEDGCLKEIEEEFIEKEGSEMATSPKLDLILETYETDDYWET